MQAHGARELAFAGAAQDCIQRAQPEDESAAQRGKGGDIRTPEEITGTLDVLRERFLGPVMRG